ncbi:MAG TPA: hemerythrin domain-containing protein [Myxococcaceae bacterium]|nr:hemerythrin domain-containing protein [Myxococcaceae bacterium]
MNAIKILEDQHREVEQMFKAFEKADIEQKEVIFTQLADALAAHATLEEKVFYPAVLVNQTEEELREAVEEHLSVKRILSDLLDMEATDEQFDAKMSALKEQVEHHVGEEETEMFVKVSKLFGKEELEALGVEMENFLATLMVEDEEPRLNTRNETDEAAPLS